MTDERQDFAAARVRLEEIVAQVRKKDTSLERSLDLLEEGVRLANICTELSDHTEWRAVIEEREQAAAVPDAAEDGGPSPEGPPDIVEDDPADVAEDGSEPDPEGDAEEPLGDAGEEASSAE